MFSPKQKVKISHDGNLLDGVVLFSEDKNGHYMVKIRDKRNKLKVWYVHKSRILNTDDLIDIPVTNSSYTLKYFTSILSKYLSKSQAKELANELLRKHVEHINR